MREVTLFYREERGQKVITRIGQKHSSGLVKATAGRPLGLATQGRVILRRRDEWRASNSPRHSSLNRFGSVSSARLASW